MGSDGLLGTFVLVLIDQSRLIRCISRSDLFRSVDEDAPVNLTRHFWSLCPVTQGAARRDPGGVDGAMAVLHVSEEES